MVSAREAKRNKELRAIGLLYHKLPVPIADRLWDADYNACAFTFSFTVQGLSEPTKRMGRPWSQVLFKIQLSENGYLSDAAIARICLEVP